MSWGFISGGVQAISSRRVGVHLSLVLKSAIAVVSGRILETGLITAWDYVVSRPLPGFWEIICWGSISHLGGRTGSDILNTFGRWTAIEID